MIGAPAESQKRRRRLLHELAIISEKLNDAEKIGNFGSFTWDFANPATSYWSEEMYELTGLVKRHKPPELGVFIEIAHIEDKAYVERVWNLAQEQAGQFEFVFRAVAPTGQTRHLKVRGKTTFTGKHMPLIQGVAHDITKELQVDEAKAEFVSFASHQLKTPLTSIKWISESLEKDMANFTAEQMQFVRTIRQESERMMGMVNDFLNVSRLELGTLIPQREVFDISELSQSVVTEQQHMADEKHITIKLTAPAGLSKVTGDKNLARMILQNLVSNAIKYTPKGGTVTCEVSSKGTLRESILIRVTDTGIGIPKNEQEHIFERLHRAANARAQVTDGTGLGLYLVKKILDQAGGSVSFESIEGKGTTFEVSMPLSWQSTAATQS